MKRLLCFVIAISGLMTTNAQVTSKAAVIAKEEEKSMSQGVRNSLVFEVPVKPDFVEDEWKDFLNDYKAKPKWMKKEKEWFSDNAIITEIGGNNPVDVYAKIENSGSEASLVTVWFDLGGAYLSSYQHAEKYAAAQHMLRTFSIKVQKDMTTKELEKEEKKFKKAEGNLKDLVKDKEQLLKDIENYKAKIKKAEDDIIKNDKDQKDAQKNIEEQKEVVKKVQEKLNQLNKA